MNKQLPLVSTIIPAYNHQEFVETAIRSVASQDYDNIELIIINDGSKDSTPQLIEKLLDDLLHRFKRLEYRSRPNKGVSATVSEALEWCKGEFIQLIASDDVYENQKTSAQVKMLQNDFEAVAVFSGYKEIDSAGTIIEVKRPRTERHYFFKDIMLNKYNNMQPGSGMYRARKLQSVSLEPENALEDYQMFLATLKDGGYFIHYPELHFQYRVHGNNTCRQENVQFLLSQARKVLQKYKEHEYFELAMSKRDLIEFYQLSAKNKTHALRLFKGASRYWYSKHFVAGLFRLVMPIVLYEFATKARASWSVHRPDF